MLEPNPKFVAVKIEVIILKHVNLKEPLFFAIPVSLSLRPSITKERKVQRISPATLDSKRNM